MLTDANCEPKLANIIIIPDAKEENLTKFFDPLAHSDLILAKSKESKFAHRHIFISYPIQKIISNINIHLPHICKYILTGDSSIYIEHTNKGRQQIYK